MSLMASLPFVYLPKTFASRKHKEKKYKVNESQARIYANKVPVHKLLKLDL